MLRARLAKLPDILHLLKGKREYKPFGVDEDTLMIWFRRLGTGRGSGLSVALSLNTPPDRVSDMLGKRWRHAKEHPDENASPVGLTDVDAFAAKVNDARAAEKKREQDEERAAAERAAAAAQAQERARLSEEERATELTRKLADREGKLARAEREKAELERSTRASSRSSRRRRRRARGSSSRSRRRRRRRRRRAPSSRGRSTRWRRR